MGADQAALELGAHVRCDVLGGQGSEAGGDPVVRLDVVGQAFDDRAALSDLGQGVSCDLHRDVIA